MAPRRSRPICLARLRRPEPTWDDVVAAFEREGLGDEPPAWLENYADEVLDLLASDDEADDVVEAFDRAA